MEKTLCNINVLPNGRKIKARKGERLLESLMGDNIFLRSDCGGRGICGKCQVEIVSADDSTTRVEACTKRVTEDFSIRIPESSILSYHVINKAPVTLPESFLSRAGNTPVNNSIGIAVDLGTTTIAIYLCDIARFTILASITVKNPQAFYGDDVMSRIGEIGQSPDKLIHLQQLVVQCIERGVDELLKICALVADKMKRMVVVGNPTMIHILLGVSPFSIGSSPYKPAFFEARQIKAIDLGFSFPEILIHTLPQVSGFIGGDILSATIATELENEPTGTLLIDLGTNGELVLKGKERCFATSCATGPAFEGATLSCGMQAIPGAIDRVYLHNRIAVPSYNVVNGKTENEAIPSGICGSGVISAVAALTRNDIVDESGLLSRSEAISSLKESNENGRRWVIVQADNTANGREISISQKDIRSVQLGKAALITGIEFLLKAGGMVMPEKIIIAGAFGSFLDKNDLLDLGMLPSIDPSKIHVAGNSAGAGAIMALCDTEYLKKLQELARTISVIDLAADIAFQEGFVQRLGFPKSA